MYKYMVRVSHIGGLWSGHIKGENPTKQTACGRTHSPLIKFAASWFTFLFILSYIVVCNGRGPPLPPRSQNEVGFLSSYTQNPFVLKFNQCLQDLTLEFLRLKFNDVKFLRLKNSHVSELLCKGCRVSMTLNCHGQNSFIPCSLKMELLKDLFSLLHIESKGIHFSITILVYLNLTKPIFEICEFLNSRHFATERTLTAGTSHL
jgi:hypothetical protein